jgi:uncharacterized protein with von Willebrand factor type A (vWA) domain
VLVRFFFELRSAAIPVSITEFLALLAALDARVAEISAQDFYYLARACLVKDERHYDRFDRVFARIFQGAEQAFAQLAATVPAEWLQSLAARVLSEEERRRVRAIGGWEKLLETLRHRRHLALRRRRLQPRRDPHRQARPRRAPRGESMGAARVPQLRRQRRARHAQSQARAAQAAQVRARGCPR